MPVYLLGVQTVFPKVKHAEPGGLLAIGGDLSNKRLELAYSEGIFPWFEPGEEIQWWSPDPRGVLFTNEVRVTNSMKQVLRSSKFTISYNRAFEQVINQCKTVYRPGQEGVTWIGDQMVDAYISLHKTGLAHSVEVWSDGQLAGGLYGLQIGSLFCGESMFSNVSNASKAALIHLARRMQAFQLPMIDCQMINPHMRSMGAREIRRTAFLKILNSLKVKPAPPALWEL